MAGHEQLELNKQKQKVEFKTEQLQESIQAQRMMFDEDNPVLVQQEKKEKISEKAAKKRGIFSKEPEEIVETKNIYGATEGEMQDSYARERKDAFRQQLLSMSADHLTMNYNPEYTEIINKIREYAEIVPERQNYRQRGQKLTEARRRIRDYISKAGNEAALPTGRQEAEALEVIKMYDLWFRTFSDGNLEEVPEGAREKALVNAEPELSEKVKTGKYESEYIDLSEQPLFAGEPNITELQRGMSEVDYGMPELAGLLMTNPMAIKNAMMEKDNVVTVRFYKIIKDSEGNTVDVRPNYITVNKRLKKDRYTKKESYLYGGLWVGILKKADEIWANHGQSITESLTGKAKEKRRFDTEDIINISYFEKRMKETTFKAAEEELDALVDVKEEHEKQRKAFSEEAGEKNAQKLEKVMNSRGADAMKSLFRRACDTVYNYAIIGEYFKTSDGIFATALKDLHIEDIQQLLEKEFSRQLQEDAKHEDEMIKEGRKRKAEKIFTEDFQTVA